MYGRIGDKVDATIRKLEVSDIAKLRAIHKESFPFPDLMHEDIISIFVAEKDNKILAAGAVKLTTEGILIIDRNQPKIARVKEIVQLTSACKHDIKAKGFHECHMFCDEHMVKLLKVLGFIQCPEEYRFVTRF